ncbi:hypothetical protein RBU60_03940 [Mesonia sp. MT50]|uniref:Outer membrane protein beta-barrel domain-containing protein n=1 Tax=Mesonia profundi TaxID=3070998 RepID=A0ABU0ZZ26_9FLAO|nr:outer membrane beta-barrel protein [Mesonia profundi]MDQ7916715.1 hypothetical protein [Mesonia profundi]
MKKLLLTAAIAVFAMMGTQAQEGLKLGAHVGLPIGDVDESSSLNIGVDVAYHWNIAEGFDLGVTTGYTTFLAKEYDLPGGGKIKGDDAGFIPIAASARYSFNEEWFVGADLGYALATQDGADGGVYYQPKVGYKFSSVDVFAFYKGISIKQTYDTPIGTIENTISAGSVGVGAAYRF